MTETIHGISQGNTQAILWGASVYFLICGLYSFIFQWRISQWESVWGSLLHTEIERLVPDNDINEREYKVKALYTYNVKGNTYEGKRLSPWIFVVSHNARLLLSQQLKRVTRNDQGQIKVFYHPQSPHKSYLILPGPVGMVFTGVFGVFPLTLYLLKYGL